MSNSDAQEKTDRLSGGLFGFVTDVFTSGMKSAQALSETAATLPWTMLENMGVPEDKTRGPKEFNLKLVGGVFRLTNKLADRALKVAAAPARLLYGTAADDQDQTQAVATQRKPSSKPRSRAKPRTQSKSRASGDETKQIKTGNFNFTENAQAVFDKSISSTPLPFRKNTRDGLTQLLLERYGEEAEISEAALVEIIKEHTPKPFVAKGMKAIKPLLSDPSLAE
jgi:hypothetical protein